MLSYQHGYHAGNLADVHKHAVLATTLNYLTQKPKPLTYFETHSGRGAYDLSGDQAQKTGEATQGILRLAEAFPADHPYTQVRTRIARVYSDTTYPGSPLIAETLLRDTDKLHFAELHPTEFEHLEDTLYGDNIKLHHRDGLEMALALTPPTPRRGACLIDPSYEVKTEYASATKTMTQLHRKWNVGVLMLWYPLLADARHRPMTRALREAIPDITLHEVGFKPARPGHGMQGSGMAIVNAPFGLHSELKRLTKLFAPL